MIKHIRRLVFSLMIVLLAGLLSFCLWQVFLAVPILAVILIIIIFCIVFLELTNGS